MSALPECVIEGSATGLCTFVGDLDLEPAIWHSVETTAAKRSWRPGRCGTLSPAKSERGSSHVNRKTTMANADEVELIREMELRVEDRHYRCQHNRQAGEKTSAVACWGKADIICQRTQV